LVVFAVVVDVVVWLLTDAADKVAGCEEGSRGWNKGYEHRSWKNGL